MKNEEKIEKTCKEGLTELVFILDRSGSMASLTEDTIGGYNSFLEKQKEVEGECLVSTVLFNQCSSVIHDRVDIKGISGMTRNDYVASGSTALIDALGDAIHHIKNVHRYIRKEDVPEKTIFVITTDGLENASRRYSSTDVKKMVEEQKQKGWEFLFLADNIDAVETAKSYGINEEMAVNYVNDSRGNRLKFETVGRAVHNMRVRGKIEPGWAEEIKADYSERKNR